MVEHGERHKRLKPDGCGWNSNRSTLANGIGSGKQLGGLVVRIASTPGRPCPCPTGEAFIAAQKGPEDRLTITTPDRLSSVIQEPVGGLQRHVAAQLWGRAVGGAMGAERLEVSDDPAALLVDVGAIEHACYATAQAAGCSLAGDDLQASPTLMGDQGVHPAGPVAGSQLIHLANHVAVSAPAARHAEQGPALQEQFQGFVGRVSSGLPGGAGAHDPLHGEFRLQAAQDPGDGDREAVVAKPISVFWIATV